MPRSAAKAPLHRQGRLRSRVLIAASLMLASAASEAARRDFFFEPVAGSGRLAQQTVTDLLQDRAGFVWVATQGGLHRLDGPEIRRIQPEPGRPGSLPDGFVTALAEAAEGGALWVGTRNAYLSRLDLAGGDFRPFPSPHPDDREVVDLLVRPDGDVWIATRSGLHWLAAGDTAPRALDGAAPIAPRTLASDAAGGAWLGAGDGLYAIDPERGIEPAWRGAEVLALHPDGDGLLLGTDLGLYRFDPGTRHAERVWSIPPGVAPGTAVRSLARDASGAIWLALGDVGLVRLDAGYRLHDWLQEEPGLPGSLPEDSLHRLLVDRSGRLWVGGQMRGVAVVDPAGARFRLIYEARADGNRTRDNSIRAILPDGDALWLGTDGDGLKRYLPGDDRFERFDAALARASGPGANRLQRIHGLARDGEWLWISGDHGLLRMRRGDGRIERAGAPGTPLRTALRRLHRGRDGNLWLGSNDQGLLQFDPAGGAWRQFRPRPGDPESLSHALVHLAFEDGEGRLWAGTDDGLNLLDRVTGKFLRFRHDPDDPHSLPGNRIRALHEDADGRLWIGTHSGLARLHEPGDGSLRFERFERLGADGEASLIVFGILSDSRGHLWLSSSNGVVEFDPSSGRHRRYGLEEGLQDYEFNGGAYARLDDGRLAFGGVRGLNVFDPVPPPRPALPPRPMLLAARIDDSGENLVGLGGLDALRLPPGVDMLQLAFPAPDPALRRQLRYRYRMDGLDSDWVEAGARAEATYTHVPAGSYRFQAQARLLDGDWQEDALELPVSVQAPWWATTPAYLAFGLLGLAAVAAVVVAGLRRRRQQAALLAELAQREERLKLALWGSGVEFWDWDIRHNRLYRLGANSLLGAADIEDSVDTAMWRSEAIHPEDLPRVQEILQQHILGKIEYFESEHRVRNAQGEWIWVLSRGKVVERDDSGDPLRMAGTSRDITASRHAEGERRIALEVLGSMSEAVAVTDIDFRFVSVNAAFSRITGYHENEVIGRSSDMLDSSQHGPEFYHRLRQGVRETGHWAGEMWQRRKDGEEFLGWIEINEVKDSHGLRSHYVAVVNDITDKKRAEQELRYLANYDTLTGLPNRALLSERLSRAIVKARRQDTRIAVLFLDLDRFKDINDSLGHSAGDRILKASAARLLAIVGPGDTVARLGGDEFTVVLEDVESLETVEEAARRVLEAFVEPLEIDDRNDVTITPSIGISLYPDHGLVPTDLLKFADTAMYQAKAAGRNTFRIYTEAMDAETRQRATMAAALRRALDRGEFRLLFQPRLSLGDGKITGVEALLRWHSQDLGEIPPVEFIPLAEESGMILQIGEWVLREACMTLRRWRKQGLNDIAMAVNVSVLQLLRGNLPEMIARTLSEIDVPAERLELEVTESMVMANAEQTTATLHSLRRLGLSIAIDDFGTGYSSLVYLKRLPIDTLKIDKEFVGDLTSDPDDEAITATVITMAHSLGLNVIAEGVETQQQLDYLREQGCDEIQGYWLSPPLDAHHCLAFMRTWQPAAGDELAELDQAVDQY